MKFEYLKVYESYGSERSTNREIIRRKKLKKRNYSQEDNKSDLLPKRHAGDRKAWECYLRE